MEKVKEILKEKYDVEMTETEYELCGQNSLMTVLIVKPHSGINYDYMIRISTVSAFDRWVNSCAIEKRFHTIQGLIQYLETEEVDIYKELLAYLSLEYEEATQ